VTIFGVDVSSWKPVKDINAVKAAGNEFLITKCTGGLTYKNPLYQDQIDKARSVGMLVGHFHYLHEATLNPDTQEGYKRPSRMKAEADWFLANLDLRPGEIVALDVEDPDVTGRLNECVLYWCDYVAGKLGFNPFIYTYPYYIKERQLLAVLTSFPLWYAEYNEPMQNSPAPWSHITLRQYTASATVPGIGRDVDRNSFEGTADDFRALGMPSLHTESIPTSGVYGPFGKTLSGGFRKFYESEPKALAYWGYPVTEEMGEGNLTVQYFERARFEWHPGSDPQNHDVLLGRLGAERVGL